VIAVDPNNSSDLPCGNYWHKYVCMPSSGMKIGLTCAAAPLVGENLEKDINQIHPHIYSPG